MFVAWRELRFARGRFLLIAAVVGLITILVGFLSGLTGGLAQRNISAVLKLPGDRVVLQQPTDGTPGFSTSSITDSAQRTWDNANGVDQALAVGITNVRVTSAGTATPTAVAAFGFPDTANSAQRTALTSLTPAGENRVGLSQGAADAMDVKIGDTITLAGKNLTVTKTRGDLWYSHVPVIVLPQNTWTAVDKAAGGNGDPTALAVSGSPDWSQLGKETGTVAKTHLASLSALESFKSEIGSLAVMIVLLFGISALVVGAFFTVWTLQRRGDIAVLKALGATTGSLIRDSLGQAAVVLVVGIGTGLAVTVGIGSLVGQALPFLVSSLTTVAPAAIMAVLGLAGAAFALRSVTKADPLTALGSNR